MLKYRLIFGTILAAAAVGILFVGPKIALWNPILLACMLLMGVVTSREFVGMLAERGRPDWRVVALFVCLVLGSNWVTIRRTPLTPGQRTFDMRTGFQEAWPTTPQWSIQGPDIFFADWNTVIVMVTFAAMAFMIIAMARYREPGGHVERIALSFFAVGYLGLLGSFFAKLGLHFLRVDVLLLTIFVPKGGDIGAYAFGSLFGRHKMTPLLSPKKTWEGFAGGLLGSVLVAIGIHVLAPTMRIGNGFRFGYLEAVIFGVIVSVVGILGDLAESLIKRDAGAKDAATSIPGFGGLLDVVDSVLFSAPVVYLWFTFISG